MKKQTTHTGRRNHPRRKPILGLTPEEVIKQMTEDARGEKVRKVRKTRDEEGPVLSEAQSGRSEGSRESRVPTAAPGNDDQRADADREGEVPDARGDKNQTQLGRVLKRMLGETPPTGLLDIEGIGKLSNNAEALAAVIMKAALEGKPWAVEMVRDQTEGKPVRAAQVNNSDGEVESMLDRISTSKLNQIAKG